MQMSITIARIKINFRCYRRQHHKYNIDREWVMCPHERTVKCKLCYFCVTVTESFCLSAKRFTRPNDWTINSFVG